MLKSLVYSLITKGSVAIVNFLILLVTSRYLGVSSRGEISIFVLNLSITQIINEIYTGYSLVHFIPRYNFKRIVLNGIFFTILFCSLSNALIVFLDKQVFGYNWLGYIVSLIVIGNTFNCVLILGRENIRMYNVLSFAQPFLLLVGILVSIFFLHDYTFHSYVYPLIGSFVIAFLFSSVLVSGLSRRSNPKKEFSLQQIIGKGFAFQLTILFYIFVNRYSYYLLPGIAQVGLYSSASSLMEALLIVVNSISPLLLAKVANHGDSEKSVNMTLALSKASFLFAVGVTLIVFLIPESLLIMVLGEGFLGIRELMLLYSPAVVMISLSGSMAYYFSAVGKQRLVLFCYLPGFAVTLLFAPFLIATYRGRGAAYSADIAYFLMSVAVCICFIVTNKVSMRRFFSFKADYRNLKQLASHNS